VSYLDDVKYGFWACLALPVVAFVIERFHGLLWHFSDHQMQERYWARRERKAAEKGAKK